MSVKASDSAPWSGRPTSDFCLSARECANLPHTALSRLEARLQLEAALEARNPRLLHKKPTAGGAPIDLYALHQVVLRLGGYRKVRAPRVSARQEEPEKGLAKRGKGHSFFAARPGAAAAPAPPHAPPGAPCPFCFARSNPRRYGTRPWRRGAWRTASSPGWFGTRCVKMGVAGAGAGAARRGSGWRAAKLPRAWRGREAPGAVARGAGATPVRTLQGRAPRATRHRARHRPRPPPRALPPRRAQYREKALRLMTWIEDDAPPQAVSALQAAARLARTSPMHRDDPVVQAFQVDLCGGESWAADAHPWFLDADALRWADIIRGDADAEATVDAHQVA